MDPLTIITAVITVSTFVKDVIELGKSIKESVDKVSWGIVTCIANAFIRLMVVIVEGRAEQRSLN